jgi:transposase-like protein
MLGRVYQIDAQPNEPAADLKSSRTSSTSPVELITRGEPRRRWSTEQKQAIAAKSFEPGVSPMDVGRKYGIGGRLISTWRRALLAAQPSSTGVVTPFARVQIARPSSPTPAPRPARCTQAAASRCWASPPPTLAPVDPCGARPLHGAQGAGSEAELAVPAHQPDCTTRQPARTLPAQVRSRLPPHHSFAVAGAQRPICAAGSRSRHATAPVRPATRQAAGRPRPAVVFWPDHNGVGRSATRRRLQVSKGSRHRSSFVSTSWMADTITVPSLRNLLCAVNSGLTVRRRRPCRLSPKQCDRA